VFASRARSIDAAASRARIELSARGETLTVADFERMAEELGEA
jgi:hypothetical protein